MQPATTEVLSIHTPKLFQTAVERAAQLLRAGEVVALPTETVYGLAAKALDADAVRRIFEIKGRPPHNPIIVHVASLEMASQYTAEWPALADKLARAFWPGPLTIVLDRSGQIPDVVTGGGTTVALRWSSHPFMQEVIRACGFPLAAPSANLSNQLSPTNAEHVRKQLGHQVSLIVDGGQCQVGIESTVIDLTESPPRVLRPGMIHEQALAAVVGDLAIGQESRGRVLKSPGQLPKHYAPKARLVILQWSDDAELSRKLVTDHASRITHVIAHSHIPAGSDFAGVSVIPHDPEAFARAIYAELHRCDDAGAELIVVEAVPESSEWRAIGDRLKRAAP